MRAEIRILDIATGTSTITRGMARFSDSVFACDIAKELLAKADELALAEGRSIEFKEARSEATGDRINFLISLSSVKLGTGSIMSRRSQK
ncbi:MAG: class I SAM-dependent methyltransferase [Proteobacteria bacterium]|nr:MAG: class I SAM-dependent methyltransferase [Pseudomonadota bacterium]